ncbi:MAG: PE-PPE domain-containing protein [Mycobacteriaceae bacterium]
MHTITRAIGIAVMTAGMALSAANAAGAANKVLMVNGLGAGDLGPLAMSAILGGAYSGTNYTRENVSWPAQAKPVVGSTYTLTQSVTTGANNLDAAIVKSLAAGDTITVVGLSAGTLVVDEEIGRLNAQTNSPDKSKLTFVVIADSSRCNFNKNRYDATIGYQYRVPAESKYNVKVVTGQYDGYADFPDRPTNLTAVANAMAGSQLVHIPSMLAPLSAVPAANIKTTTNVKGGVTTSYLVPTKTLPLVALNPKLASQEAALRKQIDAAYIRNDPKAIAAATTVAASNASPAPAAARSAASGAR